MMKDDGRQQQQLVENRSVRFHPAATAQQQYAPSDPAGGNAHESTAEDYVPTTTRSRGGAAAGRPGERPYAWLNGGGLNSGVGRPSISRMPGRDRRSLQKQRTSHFALGDLQGSAPPTRPGSRTAADPTGVSVHMPGDMNGGSGMPTTSGSSSGDIRRSKSSADILAAASFPDRAAAASASASADSAAAAIKRSRSWRRPLGRRGSSGVEDDPDAGTISFRDAALVGWLNSVLFFERKEETANNPATR